MSTERKAKLVQAAVGAVALTALMQPVMLLGYQNFVWVLFLPLLLFFALGANPKVIAPMIVGFICGQLWGVVNGLLITGLDAFLPTALAGVLGAIVVIFGMLTVHENYAARTVFGNVPAVFMGMALMFFISSITPTEGPELNPFLLLGFWLYGIVLALALIFSGVAACKAVFGKDWTPVPAPPGAPASAA